MHIKKRSIAMYLAFLLVCGCAPQTPNIHPMFPLVSSEAYMINQTNLHYYLQFEFPNYCYHYKTTKIESNRSEKRVDVYGDVVHVSGACAQSFRLVNIHEEINLDAMDYHTVVFNIFHSKKNDMIEHKVLIKQK